MFATKYIIGLIAAVFIVGAGLYVGITTKPSVNEAEETQDIVALGSNDAPNIAIDNTENTRSEYASHDTEVNVLVTHAELPEFVGNPKQTLQNRSDVRYVFVGKIVKRIGQTQRTSIVTQYDVLVLRLIDGENISQNVTLNQAGVGYIEQGPYVGQLTARDGDMNYLAAEDGKIKPSEVFLKIGGVYLFDTLSGDRKEFTISIPPYDRELITAEAGISDSAALSLARENPRVQAYVTAARELGVLNPEWGE